MQKIKWTDKDVIISNRIRNISEHPYGWIDNNILLSGFLEEMSDHEFKLYGFYCLVADWQYGLSCYNKKYICRLLKMSPRELIKVREGLAKKDLIVCKNRIFTNSKKLKFEKTIVQVLSLPVDKIVITRRRKPEDGQEKILSQFGLTKRYGRFLSEPEQDRMIVKVCRAENIDPEIQDFIKRGVRTGKIRAKK